MRTKVEEKIKLRTIISINGQKKFTSSFKETCENELQYQLSEKNSYIFQTHTRHFQDIFFNLIENLMKTEKFLKNVHMDDTVNV
jgi:hypothetical protein